MTSEPPPERARRRLGVGAAIVVVVLALAATVVIGMMRAAAAPAEQIMVVSTAAATPGAADEVYVHVAGAVAMPGLYRVFDGARIVDAIAAAGGFAEDADRTVLNLARSVGDGEQIVVPRVGEEPPVGTASGGGAAGDGRIDLNTADLAALDTLPRVGPAIAQRIIDWRDQNGRFTSVEDLLAVPGVGEKMLDTLRDLVTV